MFNMRDIEGDQMSQKIQDSPELQASVPNPKSCMNCQKNKTKPEFTLQLALQLAAAVCSLYTLYLFNSFCEGDVMTLFTF